MPSTFAAVDDDGDAVVQGGGNGSSTDPPRLRSAVARLRADGDRVTPARVAVLRTLAGTDEHLSADEIGVRVRELEPAVHQATVYRTLDALSRSGIVAHVHLPHGPATYHLAAPEAHPHLHLSCRDCDTVLDAPEDLLTEARARLLDEFGFALDPSHVALTGRCARCRTGSGTADRGSVA